MVDFVELVRAAAEDGGRVANEGVGIAQEAGVDAEPVAVKATEVDPRDRRPPGRATIVMGLPGTHRRALDAAGKRLQRGRPSRKVCTL